MRAFVLIPLAALSFAATLTFETREANAVVCARGVARAGCVSARGAAVVAKPVVVAPAAAVVTPVVVKPAMRCRTVIVNGVRVKKCV